MAEIAPVKSYVTGHKKRRKVRSPMVRHKKKKRASTGGTKHVVASEGGSL